MPVGAIVKLTAAYSLNSKEINTSHTPLGAIVKLTAAHSFNSKEIATFSLSNIDALSLVIHNYLMFEFCNVPFSIHCSPCTCTWLLVFAPALTGTKGS